MSERYYKCAACADGKVVVCHQSNEKRTCNFCGGLTNLTASQIETQERNVQAALRAGIEASEQLTQELEEFKRKYHLAANAEQKAGVKLREWEALYNETETKLNAALDDVRTEKQKNLLDRKLVLFLSAVQMWLLGAVAQHVITPCRAAEIQLQAACVPPSVLGSVSVPPKKNAQLLSDPPQAQWNHDSMAWQACDFCKHYNETNTWPAWTMAGGLKVE